ncbi:MULTISPECIES: protein-glutamate O-methyltransferase CheR [unclassified Janthinobacterium]|uniref:CheR family methyltransferase n=1 Tax=unclassified Janthinobacterium TaxID=2610881 RepID=UPI00161D5B1E|nr:MULTISPECIES: protein-glutamate O-methyltransferase CheR [unclassified Janthinobacterium]MBB5368312.1 chemotaxis protein methyltransferase CheR [Janthinobacterium sp. K2C7]MBB5382152.1 chemotaxis protein methyltransferase CheR [Janthinobacterium sp. K2Li3]MBB5386694.1 chemotaxis protein methyltransferase CheR [Janthinobacterium sp. K2E3]
MTHAPALTPEVLTTLIALVREHTGIAMTQRKSILLERRLQPRLQALSLHSYQDYLDRVVSDRDEVAHFIDLVTTNDTLFFRTPQVWDYFRDRYLPGWTRAHPGQTLKIWSAAAASGEELYSIAMLCEQFQQQVPSFRYQILASDISQQILNAAKAGQYSGRSVERIRLSHPDLLRKYFTASPYGVQVNEQLKHNVSFALHNLLEPLRPAQRFDVVFLRNVLIYFDAEHQETVLRQARHSLKDDGRLILGESETIARLGTGYQFEFPMIYKTGDA